MSPNLFTSDCKVLKDIAANVSLLSTITILPEILHLGVAIKAFNVASVILILTFLNVKLAKLAFAILVQKAETLNCPALAPFTYTVLNPEGLGSTIPSCTNSLSTVSLTVALIPGLL